MGGSVADSAHAGIYLTKPSRKASIHTQRSAATHASTDARTHPTRRPESMAGATNMAQTGMEGSKRCSHWRTISSERRRIISAAALPPGSSCELAVMRTQGCGEKVASSQSAPEKPG